MVCLILTVAAVTIAFYVLYINGWLVLQSKRAVMYTGSRRGKKASFISCTGYVKKVVKFRESRKYRFELKSELTKGEIRAILSEAGGGEILQLDSSRSVGEISVEKGRRYGLTMQFESASGKYELDWK